MADEKVYRGVFPVAEHEIPGEGKAKLYVFGSCSGTEPVEGRHHASFAIEMENGIYWFDAGENCVHTAYLMGLDILRVREIFITHCHMDHVGGLGNLLWTIRKDCWLKDALPKQDTINVHIPYLDTYNGIMQMLSHTEGDFQCGYDHKGLEIREGVIYEGQYDDIRVEAIHNTHLSREEGEGWRSFAFKVTLWANSPDKTAKTIIFSGDTNLDDLEYVLPGADEGGCDMFLMETGHHRAAKVCQYLLDQKKPIGHLMFVHHGVEILRDPAGEEAAAREVWKGQLTLAHDRMSMEI